MFPLLLITFPFYTNILEDNSPSIMRAPFEMLGILQLTFAIVPTLLEFRLCQWLCLKAWEGNEDSNGEIFVILRQQKNEITMQVLSIIECFSSSSTRQWWSTMLRRRQKATMFIGKLATTSLERLTHQTKPLQRL